MALNEARVQCIFVVAVVSLFFLAFLGVSRQSLVCPVWPGRFRANVTVTSKVAAPGTVPTLEVAYLYEYDASSRSEKKEIYGMPMVLLQRDDIVCSIVQCIA